MNVEEMRATAVANERVPRQGSICTDCGKIFDREDFDTWAVRKLSRWAEHTPMAFCSLECLANATQAWIGAYE